MELLTSPKSEYLLNGSIDVLHQQCNEWINEVDFCKDELAFFYALAVKKTLKGIPDSLKPLLELIEKEIINLTGGVLDKLMDEVVRHEDSLSYLLDSKFEDE